MSLALTLKNVVALRGTRRVIDDVTLDIEAGKMTVLIGCNGAGKSTLLSLMCGLIPLQSGSVKVQNSLLSSLSRRELSQRISSLGQDERPDDDLTAMDVVLLGRSPHLGAWGLPSESDVTMAREALSQMDALPFEKRHLRTLSGGEKQRVLLARVLCQDAAVMLLDEPTHALDPGHAMRVMQQLKKLTSVGKSVVVVLHELSLAARFGDALVVLKDGRVLAQGSAQSALRSDVLKEAFGVGMTLHHIGGSSVVVVD